MPGLVLALGLAGCGGEPSPFSPTPEEDPARHARATKEMEEIQRRNREAEAKFYAGLASKAPEGDAETTDAHGSL